MTPIATRRTLACGALPGAFVALFFALPVVAIIGRGLSGGAIVDLFRDTALARTVWFTLWQAVVSTLATLAGGLPLAFVLARYQFRGRGLAEGAIIVPFVLPTIVVGAAYLALLPDRFRHSVLAIVLAHVFFNIAVVVRTVTPLWRQLDRSTVEAAKTLGATPIQAARTITWPAIRPAVNAAAAIVFLFCFTSFGIVKLLGGATRRTIEVEIYRRTAEFLDLRGAAALALAQLVALVAALAFAGRTRTSHTPKARALDNASPARPVVLTIVLGSAALYFGAPIAALVGRAGQWHALFDRSARNALGLSLRTAAIAAVVATVLGGLAAVAIAAGGRGRRALDVGLMLPLGTSAVTVGFGLLITFNRGWYDLRGRAVMVPLAHALIGLAFVVRVVLPVLRAVDPRQRDAAATLGASPWHVWRTIDLPRLRRALMVGFGFAFAISLGEFGASSFLARRTGPTLPILIGDLLARPGAANRERAFGLAVLLAAVTAAVMVLVDRFAEKVAT